MSVFEILKKYTYDEEIIRLLSNFEKNNFEEYSYSKCVLSLGENKVNLGGLSTSNSVKENGEIFKQFLNFVNTCSQKKKEAVRKLSCDSENTGNVEWKKQKKDNKDRLLNHFILKMKNKYKLSFSEQSKLENILVVNIKLNYIPSSFINIGNNEIVDIKNLSFDEYKREWEVIMKDVNTTNIVPVNTPSSNEISSIYSKIDKYLEYRRFTIS